jgi:hypothetical protein
MLASEHASKQGSKHDGRRHATPRHATPRHATPRHATPRHATPRHATPRQHSLATADVVPVGVGSPALFLAYVPTQPPLAMSPASIAFPPASGRQQGGRNSKQRR